MERLIISQFMLNSPAWKDVYAPQGYLAVEGDYIKRVNYGRTLEKIAKEGAQAFYHGDIAKSSIRTIQKSGGIMELDDVSAVIRPSLTSAAKLRGFATSCNSPDLQRQDNIHHECSFFVSGLHETVFPQLMFRGGILLGMLNILEPYNISQAGCLDSPLNTHRLIEAMKFGFGARSEITDPSFAKNLTRINEFRTKAWADEIRRNLTDVGVMGVCGYS